ncbi:MAG: phenylalanine--tRNA ligase subunit beta [Candidatus Moranbacteria bacterium]|nr:phenylalanine--tRNA ligase subunit beta [Candidatus Moranbacteria bacterium]MDD3965072.1 phenylalanine--tRNA ligase subunit beta [Candidatus Moranbacteria bacterium]
MHYPYRFIKELSGTKKNADQLAKLLLKHSFEVEGIEKFNHGIEGVIIGHVLSVAQHPDADKLHVTQIQVGKKDIRTIVCGAPNITEGQKVAVALPGTDLPGGIHIAVAKLRGIESSGMVCSARELGLGDDHAGILVLPEDAPVGASFVNFVGLDDTIIEAKVLPDRGSDAIAFRGFAREISALDRHTPQVVEKKKTTLRIPSYNRSPKVIIDDKKACVRYLGLAFTNIVIGESPLWLKVKLILSGLRPINNIVDMTNYIMLLTGQPIHAFDTDTLAPAITIRKAKKNEKLTLLTGEVKKLTVDDLVITDTKKVLALAGVMGGKYSGITTETKNIFVEIATFDASTIRRTKTRHNLSTDASYRYERGLDPNLPGEVAHEVVALVSTLAGGKLIGMRDVYPKIAKPWKILLPISTVTNILGTSVPLFEIVQYLALLGLTVKKIQHQDTLDVTVPTRRPDLRDEWDLVEEIARMRGYDKVPAVAPLLPLETIPNNPLKTLEREMKQCLAHSSFDEIMTYSFYGEKEIVGASLPFEQHLELENPLSPDQKYLRMTLLPLLLRKTKENLRSFDTFDIFESGSIFIKDTKKKIPIETKSFGLVTVLSKKRYSETNAFSVMKGHVEQLCETLHIDNRAILWEVPEKYMSVLPTLAMFHPTRSAVLVAQGKVCGIVGELHPKTLKAYGLESRLAVAEIDTVTLGQLQNQERIFTPLQKFPYAVRDISLTFPSVSGRKVTVAEVRQFLEEVGSPLLQKCELFDLYEQDDEKRLAFHLSFGASDRTLSSQEMDDAFDRIVALASERFDARLRL